MRRTAGAIVLVAAASLSPAAETVLVEAGAPMTYLANYSDPGLGLGWTAESFDDSAWQGGLYGVGYETSSGAQALIATPVPAGASSVYSRARFTIADVGAVGNVTISADWDDGYVAWINGVEVYRSPQMPAGSPAWDEPAAPHESSNAASPVYGPAIDVTAAALPALHDGVNVLAVGVWNAALPSSDLVLVPRLSINRPASVTRGPYLQRGSPTEVVVRWRTDVPTTSRVRFGTQVGFLASSVEDPSPATEHEVALPGLLPATTYYYAVGSTSGDLAGDDPSHVFVTPPDPGTRAPLRAWVLGDSGTANANAAAVRNAYEAFTGTAHTDLWLMLGDNAYPDGTDAQYQAAVFDMYPTMLRKSVLWPTLGNHDGHTADSATQTGPYYDVFTLPAAGEAGGVPSGTEAYYSFDAANVHFISLESYETDRSASGPMLTWLRQDLLSTDQDWIVAFWHHPPYSKGSHDSDAEIELIQMRENVLPILEDGGVDLVLTGHSHSYERSFLLDGHYAVSSTFTASMKVDGGDGRADGDGAYQKPGQGPAPHAGAVYVVSGSSGQASGGLLNHPAMYVSLNTLGSFVLEVNAGRLDATFLDATGVRRDWFAMIKDLNAPPVARAGPDLQVECASPAGAVVALDGSASSDADSTPGTNDDIVLYEWFEQYGTPSQALLGTGPTLSLQRPLGAHVVTLRVTDRAGLASTDDVTATVADTTPPDLSFTVSPGVLWPPDHRLIRTVVTGTATDACGTATVVLQSVTSDEPDNAPGSGDGSTVNDVRDAATGTADFVFRLRSERDARGDGRTYTVIYRATDAAGLDAVAAQSVFVPHSRAGKRHRTLPSD